MELSVTQENFARALAIVGRIASSRAGLPILGNVLLRTEANRLLVAATNLEIAATCYVGAKITKPGELTLPAKLISEFIASLPRGTVDIVSKQRNVDDDFVGQLFINYVGRRRWRISRITIN